MDSPAATTANSLEARIKAYARELGFDDVGITTLAPSEHAEYYRAWLAAGRHGGMDYLAREDAVARRLDGPGAWPQLKSAVVLAHGYIADTADLEAAPGPAHAEIARYARGRDYHKVLKKKLLQLLERIKRDVGQPLPLARAYVDTGPVLERELARRAGLGWFGRSSMLLHPRRGSYFFLSSLLLELELAPDEPFDADHCGTCNACVSACPTGALLGRNADGAPVIDATRCISYLTIEHRGAIPRELRPRMGNRVFGCDICQEVCPFTRKFSTVTSERAFWPREGVHGTPLVELMSLSQEEFSHRFEGSPVTRTKRRGLLRNVAVALGNWGSPDAVPVLAQSLWDDEPLVRGHAAWALGRIGTIGSLQALRGRLEVEEDGWVREELELALEP